MDLYHSRLTPDDLNDLIIKYKIPRDLHPRLPSKDFVMSELPDDAIGVYHRMFDFFGVRIPFSSFLMALIKHYRIEPTVTLFKVFQTLCKQGEWFSFAKRRAPSPDCIDDNRSCMKHWKSGFFLIDRRAIPDAMVWRHPNAAIDDPKPIGSSFNMADVHHLSVHVIKLRDMPEGVLVLSRLSRVWKSRISDPVKKEPRLDVRPTFQRLPFYCTPPTAADVVIPDPTPEDLAFGTPSSKIAAKAEASQKRKASTSGATSSHVDKRTRSVLAQSSGSTTRPSLFVGDDDESDDDDDACVEILLVTTLRSTDAIPSSGNQGGSFDKGIMVDDAAASSAVVSQSRPSFGPAPSFRYVSGDTIHTDFFLFSAGPYYATYHEDGVAGNFPTPREMVRVESLSDDQLSTKMSVLHCMMMSHGGELLARYRGLNQSHHEYVLSTDFRLNGYEEKVANMTGLGLQVSALKKQGLVRKFLTSDEFSRVQGELLSLAASAGFEHGLIMHRKKDEFVVVLKKMVNFMPGVHDRLAEASPLVAQTDYAFLNKISEHAVEPLLVILQLKPKKLVHSANILTPRDARVSPPIAKESTVTPASKSLELSANVASEHNEEMGMSVILDDVVELPGVGSGHVSSGLMMLWLPFLPGRGAWYAEEHLLLRA
nr:hypothetical protein [Tanacetum cinerariifolium]